jgi:glycosyltransferase involved in cell wall biosynthesis
MNYLVAVDTFFPDRPSGSARVAWDIANLVKARGHSVTVFCRKQKESDPEEDEYEGARVIRAAFPKTASVDPLKLWRQKSAGIRSAVRSLPRENWDLVHIHSPMQGAILHAVLGDRPDYVYTVHSPALLEQEVKWASQGLAGRIKLLFGKSQLKSMEGSLLRQATRIHALSQFTRSTIDAFYGVGYKTRVIPHWCSTGFERKWSKRDARIRLGWPKDARILLSVRRLAPRMGIDVAVRAVAPLLQIDEKLFYAVVGAGPLEASLRRLAAELNAEERISFLGRVSEETLRQCYDAADLFILPTTALECFGLITLEAFMCGLPVISTDSAAIPEVMKPILPGCIVPAGDEEALRSKVSQWLHGELPLPPAESLVSYAKESFSMTRIQTAFQQFLKI